MKIDLSNIHGKIVKPQEGFQESFAASTVDVVWGGGILAAGKAGLLDSQVVTPFGLRLLKDIKVGDIISNPDTGGQERVIQLHPIQNFPFYEIKFTDGTSFRCSEGHLWKIRRTGKKTKKYDLNGERDDWRLWDTRMMYEYLKNSKKRTQKFWGLSIPYTHPIQLTRTITPTTPRNIPPYVLGVLIGDGCMTNSVIDKYHVELCTPDEFIVKRFEDFGYDMSRHNTNSINYRIYNKELINDLKVLKLAGHSAIDKFIPMFYKFATIAERKELLKGLIDTDGYVDANGHIVYTTISKQLAEDVAFVVRSIGGRASINTKNAGYKDYKGVYHKCNLAYNISITTRDNSEIVSLPKKLERVRKLGYDSDKRCYFENKIESIEYIGVKKGRCITVDNPSGLYCVDDFIVTHNSFALVLAMAEPLMTDPDFRGLISRKALQSLKAGGGFVEKFRQIFGDYCSVKESDNPRISFPNGSFCDLTYIDDSDMGRLRERAKGWEYDVIGVDEMTEMSFECFSYIMTRNRGNSKTFTGKMFATLNPKRSHWSRKFLDWYIGYDGYIIPERNGMIRYFYIRGNTVDDVVWGNTKEEVYLKCRIDIDRKLAAVGGNYSYENMIKSFVFYQGKLSENSAMLENNPDYIGSVAASGGRMSMALLEGNFNSDPDDEDNKVISNNAARSVFEEDAKRNGVRWVTVDLADYGTDNLVALAWDGLHVIDKMVLMHTTPRENAENIKIFAQNNNVGESHIIYDGVNGRYINDYIPDAVCYMSSRGAFGMYGNQSGTIKDMCYLRLCNIINSNNMSVSQSIGESTYVHSKLKKHVTIQEEFINECAAVEFRTLPNGKKKLLPKRTMNRNLSGKRSMDLLDPMAMRMLPLANYPYGEELEMEAREFVAYDDTPEYVNTDNSETVNIYDERTWA